MRKINYLPASESLVVVKPKGLAWALLASLLTFAGLLLGMTIFQLHDTVVVTGDLEPSGGMARMYAHATGVIERVAASQGGRVEKNQLLYVIRTSQSSAYSPDVQASIRRQLQKKKTFLNGKLSDLVSQSKLVQSSYKKQSDALQVQLSILRDQQAALEHERDGLKQLYDVEQSLAKKDLITAVQLASALTNYYSSIAALRDTQLRIADINNQNSKALSAMNIQMEEIKAQMQDTRASLADVSQQLSLAGAEGTEAVHSPISGVVGYLPWQEGETIRSGQLLATVVPGSTNLVAQVDLPSSAMGKVRVGDRVKIRYASYPYMQYGLFDGRVTSVALTPTTSPEEQKDGESGGYLATITLDDQSPTRSGINVRLLPGAELQATIIVGEASILRMLFGPVFEMRTLSSR